MGTRPITEFLPDGPPLTVDPLLAAIADQALTADQTRTVSPNVINEIKTSPTMRLSASTSIGGEQASVLQIGRELEAVAARCTSTAWVLWNHLAVFHLFVGTLGPPHAPLLKEIVTNNEWCVFPPEQAQASPGSSMATASSSAAVGRSVQADVMQIGPELCLRSAMPTATG